MSWIRTVKNEQARGLLREIYDEALRRTGKIFNVLRVQSIRPDTLDASTKLYVEVMHSDRSPLSRAQREMIATEVSRLNACHY